MGTWASRGSLVIDCHHGASRPVDDADRIQILLSRPLWWIAWHLYRFPKSRGPCLKIDEHCMFWELYYMELLKFTRIPNYDFPRSLFCQITSL